MIDIIFVKDGKEYSSKEAYLAALEKCGGKLDMANANMHEVLARYGFEAKQKKKTILRRIRSWYKGKIRAALLYIGGLEKYFRDE